MVKWHSSNYAHRFDGYSISLSMYYYYYATARYSLIMKLCFSILIIIGNNVVSHKHKIILT